MTFNPSCWWFITVGLKFYFIFGFPYCYTKSLVYQFRRIVITGLSGSYNKSKDIWYTNIDGASTACAEKGLGPLNLESGLIETMEQLYKVFYENHEIFVKNSFQAFLFQVNNSMPVKQSTVLAWKKLYFENYVFVFHYKKFTPSVSMKFWSS